MSASGEPGMRDSRFAQYSVRPIARRQSLCAARAVSLVRPPLFVTAFPLYPDGIGPVAGMGPQPGCPKISAP